MTEDVEHVTLGEVYRLVKRVVEQLDAMPGAYVQAAVWTQRNEVVDRALKALEDRATALEGAPDRRRVPWPSVVAALASLAAIGLTVMLALMR